MQPSITVRNIEKKVDIHDNAHFDKYNSHAIARDRIKLPPARTPTL